MSVKTLGDPWKQSVRLHTPSGLYICELDPRHGTSYAAFLRDNIEYISKYNPSYAGSFGDITPDRMRRHIVDWRAFRANAMDLVAMPWDESCIVAALTVDKGEDGVIDIGCQTHHKDEGQKLALEAVQESLRYMFDYVRARVIESKMHQDDLPARALIEAAGFAHAVDREEKRDLFGHEIDVAVSVYSYPQDVYQQRKLDPA